jgi:hypothetical protein
MDKIYHQKGVYFLKHRDFVKIGLSNNIARRIEFYRRSIPDKIVPLEVLATTDNYTERELHLRFREFRISGDWFHFSDPIRRFIRTL